MGTTAHAGGWGKRGGTPVAPHVLAADATALLTPRGMARAIPLTIDFAPGTRAILAERASARGVSRMTIRLVE